MPDRPTSSGCTTPCIACMTDESHDLAPSASPAAELRAAAEKLRSTCFLGVRTSTSNVAALLRARAPLADLLDDLSDGDDEGEINPWALAVARQILGRPE